MGPSAPRWCSTRNWIDDARRSPLHRRMKASLPLLCGLCLFATSRALAVPDDLPASWTQPQQPFRIFGDPWYVGTAGLSAVLIRSDQGSILIDGGVPQSAPLIAANIRELGFRVEDIRIIVNSHAHYDHAGGIAELQKL